MNDDMTLLREFAASDVAELFLECQPVLIVHELADNVQFVFHSLPPARMDVIGPYVSPCVCVWRVWTNRHGLGNNSIW